MTARRARKREKYPYLFGCYVDEPFERKLASEGPALITVRHYKGAMLLSVTPPRKNCGCPPVVYSAAWMRGDTLEELIATLREARRVWLVAYRRAARELEKRRRRKGRA